MAHSGTHPRARAHTHTRPCTRTRTLVLPFRLPLVLSSCFIQHLIHVRSSPIPVAWPRTWRVHFGFTRTFLRATGQKSPYDSAAKLRPIVSAGVWAIRPNRWIWFEALKSEVRGPRDPSGLFLREFLYSHGQKKLISREWDTCKSCNYILENKGCTMAGLNCWLQTSTLTSSDLKATTFSQ